MAPPLQDPQKPLSGGVDPADPSSSSECCIPGTACRTLHIRRRRGMCQSPARRRGVAPSSSRGSSSRQRGRGWPRSLLPGRPGRADATAAKGDRKTGTPAMDRERLKGPTLLLRLALRKALRFSLFRVERQEVGRASRGMPVGASQPQQQPGVCHPPASGVIRWSCPVMPQPGSIICPGCPLSENSSTATPATHTQSQSHRELGMVAPRGAT